MAKSLAGCIKKVGMDKDIADEVKERTLEIRKEEGETNQSAALMAMEEMMDETVAEIERVNEEVYAKFPELREVQEGQEEQEGQEVLEDFNTPQATVAKEPVDGIEIDGKEELERVLEEEEGTLLGLFSSFLLNRWNNGDLRVVIDMETPTSYYDPESNTVVLARRASNKTIVHELFHAMTARQIDSLEKGDPILKEIDDLRVELEAYALENNLLTVEELMMSKEEQAKLPEDKRALLYALESNDEMISMSFTNDYVREVMTEIPSKEGGTLWSKFLDILRDVWKMIGTESSALTDLMSTADDLMKVTPSEDATGIVEDFEATGSKLTFQEQTEKDLAEEKNLKKRNVLRNRMARWAKEAVETYVLGGTDVLRAISPKLERIMNTFEAMVNSNVKKRLDKLEKYHKAVKGMSKEDRARWEIARKNSNSSKERKIAEELEAKYGADTEALYQVLDEVADEMVKAGLLSKKKKGYYPNIVKDVEGLMEHLRSDQPALLLDIKKDLISKGIKEPTEGDIQRVYEEALLRGSYPAMLSIPGGAKRKAIHQVDVPMSHFYDNSLDALKKAIVSNTDAIEQRRVIGKSERGRLERRLKKEVGEVAESTQAEIDALEVEGKDSISAWVAKKTIAGKLSEHDQRKIKDIFQARFNQKGVSKGMSAIKDIQLAIALGSPMSTITQLGDAALVARRYGAKNMMTAMSKVKGKTSTVKKEDFEFQGHMRDLEDYGSKTSEYLSKVLSMTGFSQVDQFFKNVAMEASLEKARSMSKEEFTNKYASSYGNAEQAEQVYEEIQSGESTAEVKLFAFNELSGLQPVSMSRMPEGYMKGGNWRLGYALKSFGLTQMNNIVRDAREAEGVKDKAKGIAMGVAVLTLAGASTDCIRQVLRGEWCSFSEESVDNFLKIGFMSRYGLGNLGSEGVEGILGDLFGPPMDMVNLPMKDFLNLWDEDKEATFESAKLAPVIGKPLWDIFSEDNRERIEKREEERGY